MAKAIRTCTVCHDKYEYCPYCGGDRETFVMYCSRNCHKINDTLCDYQDGQLTQEQAYKAFAEYDLSKKEQYTKITKQWVDEILSYGKNSTAEVNIETVTETKVKEPVVTKQAKNKYKNEVKQTS